MVQQKVRNATLHLFPNLHTISNFFFFWTPNFCLQGSTDPRSYMIPKSFTYLKLPTMSLCFIRDTKKKNLILSSSQSTYLNARTSFKTLFLLTRPFHLSLRKVLSKLSTSTPTCLSQLLHWHTNTLMDWFSNQSKFWHTNYHAVPPKGRFQSSQNHKKYIC